MSCCGNPQQYCTLIPPLLEYLNKSGYYQHDMGSACSLAENTLLFMITYHIAVFLKQFHLLFGK